jgi:antitoxin component YwqK of YwqJK toxin-antitoxin module
MKKLFLFFIAAGIFTACSFKKEEVRVVEEFHKGGQAKIVFVYEVDGNDSIPVHEIQYHKDGSLLLEGDYKDGLREGEWKSLYPDGTTWSKGYFSKGKRHGKSWVYYPSGELRMKGTYENGKKIGKWITFNEEGIIISENEF